MRSNLSATLSRPSAWLLALGLVGLGLAAGCGGKADAQSGEGAATSEKPRNVRVLVLSTSPLEEYLELSGRAAPVRGTVVSAEEGGRVESLPARKGSRVEAGGTLVALDRRLLAAELESARASRDLAAFEAERQESLLTENMVSEYEVRAARTQLSRAQAALDVATLRHERARIPAPFAGVVTERYVELGQLISPGLAVARVVDPSVLKVECAVSDRDVALLETGKRADVQFGVDGPRVQGRVHWVGFEADPQSGKFPVEIRVDNPDLALRPGVMGRALLLKARHENVISIPRDAVIQRGGGPAAFVVEDGRAVERDLELGADQGLMVVVTRGLAAGEHLVVRGQRELVAGGPVNVTETTERPDGSLPGDPAEFGAAAAGGDGR
jgi:membrane fusion protein (multidrug efflux system)